MEVVNNWVTRVSALDPRDALFVPGGWKSLTGQGSVMHTIVRTGLNEMQRGHHSLLGEDTYSFITSNLGDGLNYHPSEPTGAKLRYRASIRINNIPGVRMRDKVLQCHAQTDNIS